MSDPDTEAALREMSRWIGSSRHRCGSLVQTWQAQEASASQGRRDLHQKFEALRGEFHAVATQVAGALKDIADIKPSVQAFENAKAQAKGAQMLGKIIWGILLFAGGGIGWMLANWITITRSRRCTDQRRSLTRKASPSNALRFVAALALVCVALFSSSAEARKVKRTYHAHPDCNVTMPCEGVTTSARGEMVVKAMGGFGSARKVYKPRAATMPRSRAAIAVGEPLQRVAASIVAHPAGCPSRAFCGCGAAVRLFGRPIRALWLAANWFRFPRAVPAPGWPRCAGTMCSCSRRTSEATPGRSMTPTPAEATDPDPRGSIAGYVIVNPRGRSA